MVICIWFVEYRVGVKGDVIIYTSVINACAKAGNPDRAEYSLKSKYFIQNLFLRF